MSIPEGLFENPEVPIKKGDKIEILKVDSTDNIIYYKYWPFTENAELDSLYGDKVFSLSKTEFIQFTQPLYRRYKGASVGAYSVPYRLRGIGKDQQFDFESSLSLQANLVFGFGRIDQQESWLDASLGLGLTAINLNDMNSNVTADRTASAFTVSLGAVVKPAKFANIGLFVGWDSLNAYDEEVDWYYTGKTWVGIGLNISFNEITTSTSPTGLKNTQ